MKKVLAILMAASLLIAGGCSKNEKATGEKTAFALGVPGGDSTTPMQVVDNFIETNKDKYDVQVDTGAWGDFMQKIKLQMVAKNDVTTVFFTDSLEAPSFSSQGVLEDLTARVDKDIDESLYSKALFALKDDKGLWGIPHAINPIAVAYNKEIFDEKGMPYPTEEWTFDDMLNMAKELTFDRDGDGETDVYGIAYSTAVTTGWWPFMLANDANPYKDNFRNSNLSDPKIQDTYEKYQKPFLEGTVPHGAVVSAYSNTDVMFADGRLAMNIMTASGNGRVNNLGPDLNWDVQIMPYGWNGKRPLVYVPNVWVMYSGATDAQKDAAWNWMQHWLSEESQIAVANANLGYPVMKTALASVASNGIKPGNKEVFYRELDEFGETILENPCSSQCSSIIQKLSNDVRDNLAPIPELIEKADKEMQEELDIYYEGL